MNEMMMQPQNQGLMTQEDVQAALAQYMAPMISAYNAMTETMGQMALSMRAMQESMDAMRKDSMRRTPLSSAQKRHLNEAIRERAEVTMRRRILPPEAGKAASADIRRKLCRRWGVRSVGEIPSCEYASAMETVQYWDDTDLVMKYI